MSTPRSDSKIVLVIRQTRLDELIRKYNSIDQARFYVEHLGVEFDDYVVEDKTYKSAVRNATLALSDVGRLHVLDRRYITNYIFGDDDIVVALGQDGLVANVLKYLDGQRLIGVNPDPLRWEGILLPFEVSEVGKIATETIAVQRRVSEVSMAQVNLNTGEHLLAVNDLFIGPKSHTSARYILTLGDRSESQSSSGVIVSTGLGSSGWLRSIVAGATGMASELSGHDLSAYNNASMPWDAKKLTFSVREPWPSKQSGAEITVGSITANQPLILTSLMPEHGVIFSDGIEADSIKFSSGMKATITLAERRGLLVE